MADILKKNISDPDGDPIESTYIERFVGTVSPCQNSPCSIQIPIPDLDFVCANEFYELSNALVVFTPNNNSNLANSYSCDNYNPAQCSGGLSVPIEVGSLSYNFDYIYECIEGEDPLISFFLTSLFGGNPTQSYSINWQYTINPGNITGTSTDFNLTDVSIPAGSTFSVNLTVNQGTLEGTPIPLNGSVPEALTYDDVFDQVTIVDIDENIPTETGSIDIEFNDDGDFFYYWSSFDDEDFYSEESRIEDLPEGTYKLTIVDTQTGTCRSEIFNIARILPIELANFNAVLSSTSRLAELLWSTTKEWENSHFEIERSDDGVKAFQKIGQVTGMGWSDEIVDYAFEDKELPLRSGPVYYRLKQVDYNGTYAYSKTMMVRLPAVQFTQGVWRAYPNPSKVGESFRISLMESTAYQGEAITMRLLNSLTATAPLTFQNETELNQHLSQVMPYAPKGLLIVELQWGNKVEHIKVMRK
ncbi:hypothetical protein [Pararhodonellum marinum]|uniref:hypothetical protein n=1 Tax=Pararhodonellum marinum TaxID=2755358 RepID=UPI00188E6369|nr:hypothetical protein [Pararhodonellum marinum]